jgi:hypothetical protein
MLSTSPAISLDYRNQQELKIKTHSQNQAVIDNLIVTEYMVYMLISD